jgi:cytoskeletal protein CcmA (bactofilin family)
MAEAHMNDCPTVLGTDTNFKGELTYEKGVQIQGRFEGKISTGGRLHITKEARVQADVEAATITVEGEVRGNLTATDRVELKATARCEGDVRASKLVMEEGAVLSGQATVGPESVKGPAASKPAVQVYVAPARPMNAGAVHAGR